MIRSAAVWIAQRNAGVHLLFFEEEGQTAAVLSRHSHGEEFVDEAVRDAVSVFGAAGDSFIGNYECACNCTVVGDAVVAKCLGTLSNTFPHPEQSAVE